MAEVPKHSVQSFLDSQWLSVSEGQLSIDVMETAREIIVRSAIAGIQAKDLDITLSDDTLTIRGSREHHAQIQRGEEIHIQECHWGAFSRSIILPAHVDSRHIDASLQRGILTIRMKKVEMQKQVHVLDLEDL